MAVNIVSQAQSPLLSFDAKGMDRRLQARVSPHECIAISFAVGILILFLMMQPPNLHYDLDNYLNAGRGDGSFYFYAHWFIPIFWLLDQLPLNLAYLVWIAVSILAVCFAARVFGGPSVLGLMSFQMVYAIFQGQITPILMGGLALFWWGMAHRRWDIAGLGWLIACTKYQIGIPLGLFMWCLAPLTWRVRWRILVLPSIVFVLSLLVSPTWVLDSWRTILNNPPNASGSLALWQWIGPFALIVWLPPLILPMPRERRLVLLAATTALGLPYFQQADLLMLFTLPLGWIPLLGNLGYLDFWFGSDVLKLLVLIPILIYATVLWKEYFVRRMTVTRQAHAESV